MKSSSIIQTIKDLPGSLMGKFTDRVSVEKIRVGIESLKAFDKVGRLQKEAAKYRLMAKTAQTKKKERYFFEAGMRMLEAARISSKYYNRGAHLENALAMYYVAIEDFNRTNEPHLIVGTEIEAKNFLNVLLADKKYHRYAKNTGLYELLGMD